MSLTELGDRIETMLARVNEFIRISSRNISLQEILDHLDFKGIHSRYDSGIAKGDPITIGCKSPLNTVTITPNTSEEGAYLLTFMSNGYPITEFKGNEIKNVYEHFYERIKTESSGLPF